MIHACQGELTSFLHLHYAKVLILDNHQPCSNPEYGHPPERYSLAPAYPTVLLSSPHRSRSDRSFTSHPPSNPLHPTPAPHLTHPKVVPTKLRPVLANVSEPKKQTLSSWSLATLSFVNAVRIGSQARTAVWDAIIRYSRWKRGM